MYTLGLSAKCQKTVKNQLFAPPDVAKSMGRFGDSRFVDVTSDHRMKMREQLYGSGRTRIPLGTTGLEVGCSGKVNYADEPSPKWISTIDVDFKPHPSECYIDPSNESRLISGYIKQSHFSLKGYGLEDTMKNSTTTTRRDYPSKFVKAARVPGPITANPPIYRDEKVEMEKQSEYKDRFPGYNCPRTQHNIDGSSTHFNFGNDTEDEWKSVTKSTFKQPSKISPVEFERAEKKPSRVIGNLDYVYEKCKSTQSSDFVMDPNVNRKTLTVDNSITVKDLKSTHFTLGNLSKPQFTSQYQSSFEQAPPLSERAQLCTLNKGSLLSIKDVDYENTWETPDSKNLDASKIELMTKDISRESKKMARELKFYQTNTSIHFGTPSKEINDLRTVSVTKRDFQAIPKTQISDCLPQVYLVPRRPFGPRAGRRPVRPLWLTSQNSPIADPDGPKQTSTSVMVHDYPSNKTSVREDADVPAAGVILGSQETRKFEGMEEYGGSNSDRLISATKRSFVNPGRDALAPPPQRMNYLFPVTLANTITRYPHLDDTFVTVSASSYVAHVVTKPKLIKPQLSDRLGDFMVSEDAETASAAEKNSYVDGLALNETGCGNANGESLAANAGTSAAEQHQVYSTETKRSFVPPEVMKVMQADQQNAMSSKHNGRSSVNNPVPILILA